jgi:hypothetical protein
MLPEVRFNGKLKHPDGGKIKKPHLLSSESCNTGKITRVI